jgi:hypothetical protein
MPETTAGSTNSFGFGVRIEDRQLADRIRRWRSQVADLTSFWVDKFAPKFLGDIQTNWDQEGAMVGGWAPNSPGYAAWKTRTAGQHLGVLEYTLRLRGSLQWLKSKGGGDIGPEGIFRPTPTSLEIGTDVPYAFKHQFGRDGMVQRRFLFMVDAGEYDVLWRDWITERGKDSGIEVGA